MVEESRVLVSSSLLFMFTSLYAMYYRNLHFSILNALLAYVEVMYWMNPVEGLWKMINNIVMGYSIFIYFIEGSYQVCVVHMETHSYLRTVSTVLTAVIFNSYLNVCFQEEPRRHCWWYYEVWFQMVAAIGQAYVIKLVSMDKSS